MGKKLYVGNLPYSYTSQQLEALFTPHGNVTSAQVIVDRATNQSRGFGFVEFDTDDAASKAAEALNGSPINGRPLTVNEARERPMGGGGGGGGGAASQVDALSQQQRQIIAATFNVQRDRRTFTPQKLRENSTVVGLSQSKLREQVEGLITRMNSEIGRAHV